MTMRWPGENHGKCMEVEKNLFYFFRFVQMLKKPVLEVLEDGVVNESSPLSKLGRIWGSGIIKDKIIEELECYWAKLAHGRTLEEVAR